jgi:hypothetical protein
LVLDFLLEALGGPATCSGVDMKMVHHGLGLSVHDWAVFEGHVVAFLDKLGIHPQERAELLGAADGLNGDVV